MLKIFLFCIASGLGFGPTQPPVIWVPGVRQRRLNADDPHDFSTNVVNVWGIASTPVCPCGMHRNFTLTLIRIKVTIALDYVVLSCSTVCTCETALHGVTYDTPITCSGSNCHDDVVVCIV